MCRNVPRLKVDAAPSARLLDSCAGTVFFYRPWRVKRGKFPLLPADFVKNCRIYLKVRGFLNFFLEFGG